MYVKGEGGRISGDAGGDSTYINGAGGGETRHVQPQPSLVSNGLLRAVDLRA